MSEQDQENRRSHELSILNDVARALNASVDLQTLLARALEKVTELLGLSTGWVLLFDEAGEPYVAAEQNLPPGLREDPKLMTGWCWCLESFRDGELDSAANIEVIGCSRLRKIVKGKTAGLRYHASVPLQVQNERLGMLNVAGPEWRELDADELSLLHTIGDLLGVAVERARLHARRLDAAQAEERNRLAREIHDTIAQDLSAIAFQLEAAEALLDGPADSDRVRKAVAAALDLTRKGLEETRRSVLNLRAAPLEGRTLAAALSDLASERNVIFESSAPSPKLSTAAEVGLYRIAQEALQNAIHHAEASRIVMRLETSPDRVRLTIEDDGQGFVIGQESSASRFGLVGMRERAHLLGGSFHLESSPGAGTRVTVEVPL